MERVDGSPAEVMAGLRVAPVAAAECVCAAARVTGSHLVCTPGTNRVRLGQVTWLYVLVLFETPADESGQFWDVCAAVCPQSAAGTPRVRGYEVRARVIVG